MPKGRSTGWLDLVGVYWLRREYAKHPVAETCRLYEERFGRPVTPKQMISANKRLRFGQRPGGGRFPKGHTPANKGRKGWSPPGSERTRFTKGSRPANERPLWSERWTHNRAKRPIREIKVPEPNPHTTAETRWVRKAVWVWRQTHGDIPKGHVVIVLDGNDANCDLENLVCVHRRALVALNHKTAPKYAGPDANPARVRRAQIKAMISERQAEVTP